jgi:hypothetical protein
MSLSKSKSFSPNAAGQENVAAHESDSVGMVSTEIGIFEK